MIGRINNGQSVNAQVAALRKHGAGKVVREVASGAKINRAQLRRVIEQLDAGDVLLVTRLDGFARSTRDLLNTLATIADRRKAGFFWVASGWALEVDPGEFGGISSDSQVTRRCKRPRSAAKIAIGGARWPSAPSQLRHAAHSLVGVSNFAGC